MNEQLRLQLACGRYDRTDALRSREIQPDGIDLDYVGIDVPREIFRRAMESNEFDAFEFSLSDYVRLAARGNSPLVAIPVFPSRLFRHGYIFVNANAGIARPEDLAGRRIGVGLYTQTAAVWIRSHLTSQFHVDLSGVTWVQEGGERSGAFQYSKALGDLLANLTVEQSVSGRPLGSQLAEGAIDALMGARIPDSFGRDPRVRRLFPNYREVERRFFEETGIYPIMHVIVLRRHVYDRAPWVARSLFDAFTRSKTRALELMRFSGAQKYMLPWLYSEIGEMDAVFGGDPWKYGVEPNRQTLSALIGQMVKERLIPHAMDLETLFIPI